MCLYVCKCQRKRPNILLYLTPLHALETESSLNLELCCQPASPSDSSLSNSTVRGFRPTFSRFLFLHRDANSGSYAFTASILAYWASSPSLWVVFRWCGRIVNDNYWLTSLSWWTRILTFLEVGMENILKEITCCTPSLKIFKRVSASEEFSDTTTSLTDEW